MDRQDGDAAYGLLLDLSRDILDRLNLQRVPEKPRKRTRPWELGGAKGIAYHYTGGPSGYKSMKWMNRASWGNEVSSCSVMILDRLVDGDPVGRAWSDLAPYEVKKLFPVPTIIMCPWTTSTWATNWINAWCLGVEMRNVGYHVNRYPLRGKLAEQINGRNWEPYTREQMISAVNIGRVARARWPDLYDPQYVVGHSMICCAKADPGPAFPLHLVRDAITDDADPTALSWIGAHAPAPDGAENDIWMEVDVGSLRDDHPHAWIHRVDKPAIGDLRDVAAQLYSMGYLTGPEMPTPDDLTRMVRWFQHSTHYYQDRMRHLKVDGDPGPLTRAALKRRMRELGL
jgi:hypothetical protein